MFIQKSTRLTVALFAVAILILLSGGAAIGSNMGFKMNKAIALVPAAPLNPQVGNNWTSIPYNNPYPTVGSFCTQTGLVSTGLNLALRGTVVMLDPVTGAFTSASGTCGTPAANAQVMPIRSGLAVRIRQPAAATGAPSSIIIVGSHNPTMVVSIPDIDDATQPAPLEPQIGNFWFSVPYHTTAVTVNDLCLSAGLTSTGLSNRATVTKLDASTGAFTGRTCGTTAAAAEPLVLGSAVLIRDPQSSTTATAPPRIFIPAHF